MSNEVIISLFFPGSFIILIDKFEPSSKKREKYFISKPLKLRQSVINAFRIDFLYIVVFSVSYKKSLA